MPSLLKNSFQSYLNRLKLSLRSNTCCVCKSPLNSAQNRSDCHHHICHGCKPVIHMRDTLPILETPIANAYAVCDYPKDMKRWLYQIKFNENNQSALMFSELVLHYMEEAGLLKDSEHYNNIFLPIPSHQQAQRGHLSQIYQPVASELGWIYLQNFLNWRRPVHFQHNLPNKKQRRENVREAFVLNETQFSSKVKEHHKPTRFIVVDDIYTSGATMTEALITLKVAYPDTKLIGISLCHLPFGSV